MLGNYYDPPSESALSTKMMVRLAFTFFLLFSVVGCQNAAVRSKPTFAARSPKPANPSSKEVPTTPFWSRTAQFFKSVVSDTSKRSGRKNTESESVESPALIAQHAVVDHQDDVAILPVGHSASSPFSLFKPESITTVLPSLENQTQAHSIPRQEQKESYRTEHLLTADTSEEQGSETILSEKPLSEEPYSLQNPLLDAAPMPDEKTIAEFKHPAAKREWNREEYEKQNNDTNDYALEDDEYEFMMKSRLPSPSEKRHDRIVARAHFSTKESPVYPSLTQIPSTGGTVQTNYQQTVSPPVTSYGNVDYRTAGYGAGDWQTPARQAIEQLRYTIEQTPHGKTTSNEMRLRMLETLLGNRNEAAKTIPSASTAINGFMQHQVLGFSTLLDDSLQDDSAKYINAAYRFNEGLMQLQDLCPLSMKNVVILDDIKNYGGYGQYFPHPTSEFQAGDTFYVYIELENPIANKISEGFEISVLLRYEVYDADSNVVFDFSGETGDRFVTRKRDHALQFPCRLPTTLKPGKYQIRISLDDLNDELMRYTTEQIPFRIAPALAGE